MKTTILVLFGLIVPVSAIGQDGPCASGGCQEEHQPEPDSCMGPEDPFCPRRHIGDPYDWSTGCYECEWIPEGPDGQPEQWICVNTGEAGNPEDCSDYFDGCDMSDSYCIAA